MKVRRLFAWYDAWVGAFWDGKGRRLYLLPIPFAGVVLELGPPRVFKSGMDRCFWRWTSVVLDGWEYLRRLHVFRFEWASRLGARRGGAVMLHWINGPDPQPDPHDHPVSFLSIVLRGGYVEHRYRRSGNGGAWWIVEVHPVRWFNLIRSRDVHRIVEVRPGTVTLAIAGPTTREWGFHTPRGWVDRRTYAEGSR